MVQRNKPIEMIDLIVEKFFDGSNILFVLSAKSSIYPDEAKRCLKRMLRDHNYILFSLAVCPSL